VSLNFKGRTWLAIEFALLFFGIPTWIYLDQDFTHPSIILLPVLVFIFLLLRQNPEFTWRELITWSVPRKTLYGSALIILAAALLMLGYVWMFERQNLFNLPRTNIWIFLAMCIFYPVFSAYSQEIIYRTFLSRRYGSIFPRGWQFVLISAVTFSFLHIVYYDPVSLILTFIGGLYFAWMYRLTRSVLFTSVLDGILGMIVFGVGVGQYFWLDMPVG
jgi:membrane protease YdiL (CAAX protease family)